MVHASYWLKGISIRKADQHVAPPPPTLYSIHLCAMVPSHHQVTVPSPPLIPMQWTRNTEQVMQQTCHSPWTTVASCHAHCGCGSLSSTAVESFLNNCRLRPVKGAESARKLLVERNMHR